MSQSVPGGTAVVFICYEREKKYLQIETNYMCMCRGTSPDRDIRHHVWPVTLPPPSLCRALRDINALGLAGYN